MKAAIVASKLTSEKVPTMNETPPRAPGIACSLGPSDLPERVAAWRQLGQEALIDRVRSPLRATLTYRDHGDVAARLEWLVDLERDCCSFLDFHLRVAGATIVLEIDGPADAGPLLDLFASDPFAPQGT